MISLVIVYRLRLLESTLQMTFSELANRPVLLIILPEANVTLLLLECELRRERLLDWMPKKNSLRLLN